MTSIMPVTPGVPAGLKILTGERAGHVIYPLGAESTLGRMKSVSIFLPDLKASRNHAMILWDRGCRWILMDLSSNGTYLNNERITRASDVPLNSGDVIRIGATEMEFRTVATAVPAGAGAPVAPPPAPTAGQPRVLPPTEVHQRPAPVRVPPPTPVAPAPVLPTHNVPANNPAPAPANNPAPVPVPVLASGDPPPVEYVFDFTEDEDPQENLNKVFEDASDTRWTSTATQEFSVEALRQELLDDDGA